MARRQMGPTGTAIYALQQRFGWRKAAWVLEFLAMWTLAMRKHGWEPITAEQYGEYMAISRAKAYRDRQRWADLFPEEPDPTPRILAARAEFEKAIADAETKEPTKGQMAAMISTMAF